eukprot:gene366-425_t
MSRGTTTTVVLLCIVATLCCLQTVDAKKKHNSDGAKDSLLQLSEIPPYVFANVSGCSECADYGGLTFWCSGNSICIANISANASVSVWPSCNQGWCSGDDCCAGECVKSIWPCSNTVMGMLILMAFYGVLLAAGAKLISDGSELLLEILDPGIIGGLLLPLLSAFPDAAIIVVAGAFGNDPQTQLGVGIGTLAGSTVMLLTIPWSISLYLARCDLNRNGESIDGVCTSRSLTETGVTVDEDTPLNAKIMMATSLSYFIVQGVAFAYLSDPQDGKRVEKWFALAGFLVSIVLLVTYCVYQVISPKLQEKKMAEAKRQYMLKQTLHHFMHNLAKRRAFSPAPAATASGSSATGNDGDDHETSSLLHEEHQKLPVDVKGMGLKWKTNAKKKAAAAPADASIQVKEEEEEKETEEGPINKRAIAIRAAVLLAIGSVMVSLFSDPMVGVITDFGAKLNIKVFFISFIVTPFCSNASELISSLIFSSKKKRANSSLTYSAIYGSATMNNTLCLGIFFALVYFRNLSWQYSAECVTIIFVTFCVGTIGALKRTKKLYWAPIVLSLYPLSLVLVYVLETFAHWQ